MVDTNHAPDFKRDIDKEAFSIGGDNGAALGQQGDAIAKQERGVNYNWDALNALLDKAHGQSAEYLNQAATGEGVYQGQEERLRQQDLGAGANAVSPASIGQALIKIAHGSAAQAADVGAAQGAGQEGQARKGLALQQVVMQERAAMMQSELQLQSQKSAITNSVAQVQQGIQLAQTHLTNMYNNALSSATNSQQYAQLQADQVAFAQIMDYVKAGLGGAATATAAGANYLKQNPQSTFSMALNPNNVWSSSEGYSSGDYGKTYSYVPTDSTNLAPATSGATEVTGVSGPGYTDSGSNIG